MKRRLLIATAAAALIAGNGLAFAQSPSAPQGSAEKAASDVKEAPRTGDSSNVGGTPSADIKAKDSQKGALNKNSAPLGSAAQKADQAQQGARTGDADTKSSTKKKDAM